MKRHLDNLTRIGVRHVCIGVGYRAEDIEVEAAAADFPGEISYASNPHYTEGSVITLSVFERQMATADGPVILMDADVLYDPRMMARLANSEHANCLLVDRDFEDGDEPVKVCITGPSTVVDFRKIVDTPFDWCGELVGFFKWSPDLARELVDGAKAYIDRGDREAPYEEVICDAILRDPGRIGFEDVTGIPWVEIDFPEDVARANDEILPRIGVGIR